MHRTAPAQEKTWVVLGPEFGSDMGKRATVVCALHGLKSAGNAFRSHLADCMCNLGCTPCLADPDVWIKPENGPEDGFPCYSHILLCVDDILCTHHGGVSVPHKVDKFFMMKPDLIGDPDMHLGAKLRRVTLPNGVEAWSLSPSKHVQEAVKTMEDHLHKECDGWKLKKRAMTPFPKDHRLEFDLSEELGPAQASPHQTCMGVLQWMAELGRIDMITEASLLASQLALSRVGHLEVVCHLCAHLKIEHNSRMVFDPTHPTVDLSQFKECDWKGV